MNPNYKITIEGDDLGRFAKSRLISLTATDDVGFESDKCTLIFEDNDDLEVPEADKKITIALGYGDSLSEIGSYILDDVEFGSVGEMIIQGKGFNTNTGLKQFANKTYFATNLGDFVGSVADENGLKAFIQTDIKDIKIENKIIQRRESYLHLLTRILKKYDCVYKIQQDKIAITKKSSAKTASGSLFPEIDIVKNSSVQYWDCKYSGRSRYKSAKAIVNDTSTGKKNHILQGKGNPQYLFRESFPNEYEAEAACKAKLRDSTFKSRSLSLTLDGRTDIRTETILNLKGFREKIDGKWIVKKVSHEFKGRYNMKIDLEDYIKE